jgi:Ca2+-binding EF-hand superfamily protein
LSRHGLKKKALREKNVNDDLNKIFSVADKNNDGKIDFE